jgi:hypothetical protein
MGGRVAIALAALVFAVGGGVSANATPPVTIGEPLSTGFHFDLTPAQLPRAKPAPVRLSIFGSNRTNDGSHVPALREVELKLDQRFSFDLTDVPVCAYGLHTDVRPSDIETRCADAVVANGQITLEVAFPEQPLTTVTGLLTVYNRGRKPGGFDLIGWVYFPAPVTGGIYLPIQVRKVDIGRYGWRAKLEVPKIASGSGSVTAYSMHFRKRIVSATCGGKQLQIGATSTFADGAERAATGIHTCTVAKDDTRHQPS